jgi:hypothetical protein
VKVWVIIGGEPDIFGLIQAVDFWFCSWSVLEWLSDFALVAGSMVLRVWTNALLSLFVNFCGCVITPYCRSLNRLNSWLLAFFRTPVFVSGILSVWVL